MIAAPDRLAQGETVDPSEYYFRVAPVLKLEPSATLG
jgi:hypothetical protein